MPEPKAVQLPQRGPSEEEEDIHSPSFKDCLLGVTKMVGLTPSLRSIKGDNYLKCDKERENTGSSNMIIWFSGFIPKEKDEDRKTVLG